jgi:hypothetical protein
MKRIYRTIYLSTVLALPLVTTLEHSSYAMDVEHAPTELTGEERQELEKEIDQFLTELEKVNPDNVRLADSRRSLQEIYVENRGTILNLMGTNITTLPDAIKNLFRLKKLHLPYGKLTDLPETIGNLSHLQYLFLFNNQLTTLPNELWNCPALTHIDVRNNSQFMLTEVQLYNWLKSLKDRDNVKIWVGETKLHHKTSCITLGFCPLDVIRNRLAILM